MENKEKTLINFLEFKKQSVKTEKALRIVERYTSHFINFFKKPLKDFNENDLVKYFNYLDNNFSQSSANDLKVMVKVFVKWYYEDWSKRFRHLDKLCKRKQVEPKYTPEDMLKKEDVEKLVQAEKEIYWKAFWLIYFYGGFRPTEVCSLKWENITFSGDEAFVTLRATKNNKTFEKYLPSNAVFYLKKMQNNGSYYVFPTKRKHKNTTKKDKKKISVGDKPLTHSGVYQHLRDLAPKVFGKRINPYILRHSIATILYNKDDLKDDNVAQQMGHSTNMKKVYSHPTKKEIREKMKKLYIKAEDLPEEKKHELEERIKSLEKDQKRLNEENKEMINAIRERNDQDKKLNPKFLEVVEILEGKIKELQKNVKKLKKQ